MKRSNVVKLILIGFFFNISLFATNVKVEDYINMKDCDQIIDKQYYNICYSYKHKGPLGGWLKLDGNLTDKGNIKTRPKFYNESTIPMKYRTKYADYTGQGKDWNRGHFIVADADFDYDEKVLNKAYTMANIIPQSSKMNQHTWTKVERYGRMLAKKYGYINSVSIAKYYSNNKLKKNNVGIPDVLYRVYFNNKENFEMCFRYDNVLNIDIKSDKIKNHKIDCNEIKINYSSH